MLKKMFLVTVFLAVYMVSPVFSEDFIVKDGVGNAEIVVSETPSRAAKFAAGELQKYIKKLSGAELPVVTSPADNVAVKIYVGKSKYTDSLKVSDDGLKSGAFIMKSIGTSLVLLGNDIDFVPIEPYPRSRSDIKRVNQEWDKLTRGLWRNPVNSMFKDYNKKLGMWSQDTKGTLNAVYGYLRSLGVRWYMPGELGEIIPEMKTIPLSAVDNVVRPKFEFRFMSFVRYAIAKEDHLLWAMRIGVNNPYGYYIAHGMREITSREEMRKAHPEFYSIFKGKRDLKGRHVCYSSKALVKECARFARAMFDIYDYPMVSVMPEDGFSHACECPECMAKATPERTSAGKYSDYVWEFVNEVAKEVYKTHPDKFITCCAYSTYRLPPLKIKKFNPNVIVGIVGGRGFRISDPAKRDLVQKLQQDWAGKLSTKIFIFENYPFTNRAKYMVPGLYPHAISLGMKEVKDISMGESVWMSESRGLHAPELSHLNYYVTTRLFWDPDRDIDELLNEYYKLYFGPAADEMKAFYEHCEQNSQYMRVNPHPSMKKQVIAMVDKVFDLLDSAKKKAGEGSVYYQRIDKMAEWLVTLKDMRDKIAEGRKNVPELPIKDSSGTKITLDGKLDENIWKDIEFSPYKELKSGNVPEVKTFFKAFWADNNLYLGFRCEDPDMASLNITAKEDDDARAWRGDVIELLIETDQHSFYQLVINPVGVLVDLDRNVTKNDLSWDSMAFVETSQDKDAWYVELKIPILAESDDPLHNLAGNKPVKDNPWHFNFCRQRLRENANEFSAFSPTGNKGFAELMKFAKLYTE